MLKKLLPLYIIILFLMSSCGWRYCDRHPRNPFCYSHYHYRWYFFWHPGYRHYETWCTHHHRQYYERGGNLRQPAENGRSVIEHAQGSGSHEPVNINHGNTGERTENVSQINHTESRQERRSARRAAKASRKSVQRASSHKSESRAVNHSSGGGHAPSHNSGGHSGGGHSSGGGHHSGGGGHGHSNHLENK